MQNSMLNMTVQQSSVCTDADIWKMGGMSAKGRLCESSRTRRKQYEKERNDQKDRSGQERIPVVADRRADQGTQRLEGQDARPCPRSDQTGRPGGGRGVEVARRSGLVARRHHLHRRDI